VLEPNFQQRLDVASKQIKDAGEFVFVAQGSDAKSIQQAHQLLQQAEQQLDSTQSLYGVEVTENSQFQQAFEQLHDMRQQVTEAKANSSNNFK